MSKKELETAYFNHTRVMYKAKKKEDILQVIKNHNRASEYGKAFRKMVSK
jgi:hypothetical protein